MTAEITEIYRYPVKGLRAEPLERVELRPGHGLLHDRRFALARATAPYDPDQPRWLPKTHFFTLATDARLAQLGLSFDSDTGMLVLSRAGKTVTRAHATAPMGRAMLGQFFASFLGPAARGTPRFLETAGRPFWDSPQGLLSLINLNSVRDLARVAHRDVEPARFRGNIYFDGPEAWSEFDWLGKELHIADARLKVTDAIERCAATNVNPATAARDMNLPQIMQRGLGHARIGLYAEIIKGGTIACRDKIVIAD